MKLDIAPTQKPSPELGFNLRLKYYGKPLYAIEKSDGTPFSAVWDSEGIDSFKPNSNLSDVISNWENSSNTKLVFVEYVYNPDVEYNPMRGKKIKAIAKRDVFDWCKKGDEVTLQSILYDKPQLLVNAIAYVILKSGETRMANYCPDELKDKPVGTTMVHPKNPEITYIKAFDEVIAPVGSFKDLVILTEKGEFSLSRLPSNAATYFEKIKN